MNTSSNKLLITLHYRKRFPQQSRIFEASVAYTLDNMSSKVENMLQQLEPAFLASSSHLSSPLYLSASDFKVARRSRLKDELSSQISAMSSAADDKEEVLRTEIDEAEVRLEGVLAAKRRVKQEGKYTSEAFEHKKETLLVSIQKLQKQYDDLEEAQQNIETGLDNDQAEKLNAFRAALRPLEDAEHAIRTEKERLSRYNGQFNERLTPLQESLQMTKEDIRAHIVASEEALLARKNFETQLSVFKEKHEEELADFLEELETREMLKNIRARKAEQIDKVRKVDRKVVENEKQLAELRSKLSYLTRNATSPPANADTSQVVERLETLVHVKGKDLGMPPLVEVVRETNRRAGYDIEEMISRTQLERIERKEREMEEEWKDEIATLESELSALQNRLAIDEKALAGQVAQGRAPDAFLEKTRREEKAKATTYLDSIMAIKERNKHRQEVINKWKLQVRASLGDAPPQRAMPVSDGDLIVAYAEAVSDRTSDPDEQRSISDSLKALSQQLQEAASLAGRRDERNRMRREAIEEASGQVQSAEFIKSSLAMERSALQKELTKLITTEKAVSKRFEQMKMKSESSQKRAHEDLLSSELSSRSGEMSMIFKTMGTKAQQKLADKTKQDLARTVTSRQRDRRARLEEKYKEYESWDRVAHWHASAIDDVLKPQYQAISAQISSLKREADKLKEQLQAVLDAEDDLSVKTESIVERKKKELRMSLNQAARALQSHVKTRKLEALKEQLIAKVQKLEEMEQFGAEQNSQYQGKLSDIVLEETQLKTRLSELQAEMAEVGINRESVKHLEKRLKGLDRSGKAPVQSLKPSLPNFKDAPSFPKPLHRSKSLPCLTFESLRRGARVKKHEVNFEARADTMVVVDMEEGRAQADINSSSCLLPRYEILLEKCTKAEKDFFAAVTPLLDGIHVYKRTIALSKGKDFDPLEGLNAESSGFVLRDLRLAKALNKLEIRQPGKPGVDYVVMISQLLEPVVPRLTSAILSAQKKPSGEPVDNPRTKYLEMKEQGAVNYSSPAFIQLSRETQLYPFALHLTKGGRVELLARRPEDLRQVIEGVKALQKHALELTRLKYKIE